MGKCHVATERKPGSCPISELRVTLQQVAFKNMRTAISVIGILLQELDDDLAEDRWEFGPNSAGIRYRRGDVRIRQRDRIGLTIGRPTTGHVKQGRAKAVKVGSLIGTTSTRPVISGAA